MTGFIEEVSLFLSNLVEVSGRPIHRKSCMVPRTVNGDHGYEYVVPLLVKEGEKQ